MPGNARSHETAGAQCFCVECGTSEHSARLAIPGAESTVNINRGSRLRAPKACQESNSDSREGGGVLLELPTPTTSAKDDSAVIEPASDVAETQYRSTDLTLPKASAVHPSPSEHSERRPVHLRSFGLGAAGVMLVSLIAGIAWHVGEKRANSSSPGSAVGSAVVGVNEFNGKTVVPVSQLPANNNVDDLQVPGAQATVLEKQGGASTATQHTSSRNAPELAPTRLAPEQRSASTSPVELANRYLRGQGVPRSCDKAVNLLTGAAGKGNVRACNQLASMYAIGSCVPRDRVQAYRWLGAALAADPHDDWAQRNRDLMLSQMTPAELSRLKVNR